MFVYGSLRRGVAAEAKAAVSVLSAHAARVGEASVQGALYAVSWYPGYVSGRARSERVTGELWRIRDRAGLFEALDAFEGPQFVRRRRVARLRSGEKVDAWVYMFAASLDGAPRICSGDYADWLRTNGTLR